MAENTEATQLGVSDPEVERVGSFVHGPPQCEPGNANPSCGGYAATLLVCVPRPDGTFLCVHQPIPAGDLPPEGGGEEIAQVLDGPPVDKIVHSGVNCGEEHGPDCSGTDPTWLGVCEDRTDGKKNCYHQPSSGEPGDPIDPGLG